MFRRAANAESAREISPKLGSKKNRDAWASTKKELKISDAQLLKLARAVHFKQIIDIEDMRSRIQAVFHEKTTNHQFVSHTLYELATDSAKESKRVRRTDIIRFLRQNDIHLKSVDSSDDILSQFQSASAILSNWRSTTFGSLRESHILRKEVEQTIMWVKNPLQEERDPLFLIVGGAGSGKTVVMHDIVRELEKENISHLALKADLQSGRNPDEFQHGITLTESVERQVASLSEQYDRVVVLVDQLDALSQSLSADRARLENYFVTIQKLTALKNVRVVISCRKFDLEYDPILKQFDKAQRLEIGNLTDQEIDATLIQLGVNPGSITGVLRNLLSTPLHLDIFCTVYSDRLNLASISTLQDLYDELWGQKILSMHARESTPKLNEALSAVADYIYDTQQLSAPLGQFADRWTREVAYMLHESLFIGVGKHFQFFHQSFFDYTFARLFVTSGKSISAELLKIHQGLFARSQIRQVITYLRSVNHGVYTDEFVTMLQSKRVRFHVKLMLLQQLGFEKEPSDAEWLVVKDRILPDKLFRFRFLEAIRSGRWVQRLIDSGLLSEFLSSDDEELVRTIYWMLSGMVQSQARLVLDFLDKCPQASAHGDQIMHVLANVTDWTIPAATRLFEKYDAGINSPNRWWERSILESAIDSNSEWVASHLVSCVVEDAELTSDGEVVSKRNIMSDDLDIVFEKLRSKDPFLFLSSALAIISALATKARRKEDSEFFSDWAFMGHWNNESLYPHWKLRDMAYAQLHELASKEPERFRSLQADIQQSNSLTLLGLALPGYLASPHVFRMEIFNLLSRGGFLCHHNVDGSLGHDLRKLIGEVFPLLQEGQRQSLIEIILRSEPEWERGKEARGYRGHNQFLLLGAVPGEFLRQHVKAHRLFQELERKFGRYSNPKASTSEGGVVGPPLPATAYKFMSPKQWLDSFREYGQSTGWKAGGRFQNKRGFLFGGLVEHARAFKEVVKGRAEEFYPFVVQLLNEDVSPEYLSHGIDGLVEGAFDPSRLVQIVEMASKKSGGRETRRTLIRAIEYLAEHDYLNENIVDYLGHLATCDPDPVTELWQPKNQDDTIYYGGDPLTAGINSIRGAAVWALARVVHSSDFRTKAFDYLDQAADDPSVSVRCCAVVHSAYFIRHDKVRTRQLVLAATKDLYPHVISYSLQCISYLMRDGFNDFVPHLKVAMRISGGHRDQNVQHEVGGILMLAVVLGKRGSRSLLDQACRISDQAKAGAVDFSVRHLLFHRPSVRKYSQAVFKRFLKNPSDQVQDEYARAFSGFSPVDMGRLFPFLELYTKSVAYRERHLSHFFFEYIGKCTAQEPEKVLRLLVNFVRRTSENTSPSFYGEAPSQILVSAYSRLKEYRKPRRILEDAMDLFDTMLLSNAYRGSVQGALNKIDMS